MSDKVSTITDYLSPEGYHALLVAGNSVVAYGTLDIRIEVLST